MIKQYRRKSDWIEAVQWNGWNTQDIATFLKENTGFGLFAYEKKQMGYKKDWVLHIEYLNRPMEYILHVWDYLVLERHRSSTSLTRMNEVEFSMLYVPLEPLPHDPGIGKEQYENLKNEVEAAKPFLGLGYANSLDHALSYMYCFNPDYKDYARHQDLAINAIASCIGAAGELARKLAQINAVAAKTPSKNEEG